MILTFKPIDKWPDSWDRNKQGKYSPFRGTYSSTLDLLDKELGALNAKSAFLQVDIDASKIRLDGQIRADARSNYRGVILTIDTPDHGVLSYPCDTFEARWRDEQDWHPNLRAIALGLEALRLVERYGIANCGEQYAGFAQLGSGIAMGSGSMTLDEAAKVLFIASGWRGPWDPFADPSQIGAAYRMGVKLLHPDQGGDADLFRQLTEARDLLVSRG